MLGAAGVGIGDAGVAGMPGAAGMMIPGGMEGCPVPQWGPVRQRCPAEPGGMRGCPKGTWGRRGTWGAPGVRVVGVGWVGVWKGPPNPPSRGCPVCVPQRPAGGGLGPFLPRGTAPSCCRGGCSPTEGGWSSVSPRRSPRGCSAVASGEGQLTPGGGRDPGWVRGTWMASAGLTEEGSGSV